MNKINGFVYRDDEHMYLVPLASEKKVIIWDDVYLRCDGGNPLKEESIALCWYEQVDYDHITTPVVVADLIFNDKPVKCSNIKFDNLVTCAYNACIAYTKKKKPDPINI